MATLSRIGEKTVIVGNVHGDGDLEVLGRVSGDITVEGNVLVAGSAVVKGAISASVIRVAGSVEGNLEATDTISIEPDAQLLGDMTTPRISIAEGATVRGMLRTEAGRTGRERPAQPRAIPSGTAVLEAPSPRYSPPELPRVADHSRAEPEPVPEMEPVPDSEPRKKGKHKDKRPPEPKVPVLAKRTKGKKKGDRR